MTSYNHIVYSQLNCMANTMYSKHSHQTTRRRSGRSYCMLHVRSNQQLTADIFCQLNNLTNSIPKHIFLMAAHGLHTNSHARAAHVQPPVLMTSTQYYSPLEPTALMSMETLTRRSIDCMAGTSPSLMLSRNTSSSGKRTFGRVFCSFANKLARRLIVQARDDVTTTPN